MNQESFHRKELAGFICKEAVFDLSFVFASLEGGVPAKEQCGCTWFVHGVGEDFEQWTVLGKFFSAGHDQGQHWHNTKWWEFFIVVSGEAIIQERRIGTDEVLSFEVSGKEINPSTCCRDIRLLL